MVQETITSQDRIKAIDTLVELCHGHLLSPDGKQVLNYLMDSRKLTRKTIDHFKLGMFPRYADVAAKAIGSFTAWKLGIVGFSAEGEIVSKFQQNNIIIPIHDQYGQGHAIIARSMMSEAERQKTDLPKYINSHYKKSSNLFGLHHAVDRARETGELFLVEGNLDVITAFQHGLYNVAGVSNSSLGRNQICLSARYARRIRLLLDGDAAGQAGTARALELYGKIPGVEIVAGKLPKDCKDLDEFFLKGHRIEELE